MKHRFVIPSSAAAPTDCAPRNPSPFSRRERWIATLIKLFMIAAVLVSAYAFGGFALEQAVVVEALCSTDMDCFERYCAQDLSCDGGPEPVR